MGDPKKKVLKAEAKAAKKRAKAEKKRAKAEQAPVRVTETPAATSPPEPLVKRHPSAEGRNKTKGAGGSSQLVRFAEGVRGVLFLIFAVSLVILILAPDVGQSLGMKEIIDKLIGHWIGKAVLVVIAAAFFIYGLKYLRAIK